jgi:uncharacterized protein YdeI (YjbR/CyaY-like superfamily)
VPRPTYFATPADWRRWLEQNHATAGELLVGFHKRATGTPSITWPESVDEALCFGWIDGVRRSLGDASYTIRFTPRRVGSIWSANNIDRVAELERQGKMRPAGRAAFARRDEKRSRVYSYERATATLPAFAGQAKAWTYYQAQPPWYRRVAAHWVTSAKREETRARRLATLIDRSAAGEWIPGLQRPRKSRT